MLVNNYILSIFISAIGVFAVIATVVAMRVSMTDRAREYSLKYADKLDRKFRIRVEFLGGKVKQLNSLTGGADDDQVLNEKHSASKRSSNSSALINVIVYIRSLAFGGLAGGSIAATLFLSGLLPSNLKLDNVFLVGSLLGAIAHRLIDTIILKAMLTPIPAFIRYYSLLAELKLLRSQSMISEEQFQLISEKLASQYFLSNTSEAKALGVDVQKDKARDTTVQNEAERDA
jgi:hypothetical protein